MAKALRDLVARRNARLMPLAMRAIEGNLETEDRETLRGLALEEMLDTGLGPDDEPNPMGMLMEDLIAWLGTRGHFE